MPQPVFVDVDTGVDDAMALAYLFGSSDAELVGIASTAGNVPVQQVAKTTCDSWNCAGSTAFRSPRGRSCRSVRRFAPPRTPMGRGAGLCHLAVDGSAAHRARRRAGVDPGGPRPSRRVDRCGDRPLTNLALALREEPALPRLLRRLVIMGGAFEYRGNTTPVAEWNISVDPEAASEVFAVWNAAWGLDRPNIFRSCWD